MGDWLPVYFSSFESLNFIISNAVEGDIFWNKFYYSADLFYGFIKAAEGLFISFSIAFGSSNLVILESYEIWLFNKLSV